MKFICAFYTVLYISKFSTKRKYDYNSGGKTLKILKYKIKFQNANLVISKLHEWVGRGGAAAGHCVPGAQGARLENCEQRRPSQRQTLEQCLGPQELGEARKDPPQKPSEEHSPDNTLILQTPDL